MFNCVKCLLDKHAGSISRVANTLFRLFPSGRGLLALIIVYKGAQALHCMSNSLFSSVYMRWSVNGLDDK